MQGTYLRVADSVLGFRNEITLNKLSKDEAREETLRRWRALPAQERQTTEQAEIFAAALADELGFHTMGNARKIIFGWLTHELAGLPPWGNLLPESLVVKHQGGGND